MDTSAKHALPGLVRLGLAVVVLMGSVTAGAAVVSLHLERRSDFSLLAPFPGWQVNAAETAWAALALVAAALALLEVRRTWRALEEVTPHRRAVVMAVVLPGLVLGGSVRGPIASTVTWASDHTSAAATAKAQWRAEMGDVDHPPLPPAYGPGPASAGTAAVLLHAADLGAGWYDGQRPNPGAGSLSAAGRAAGALDAGLSHLVRRHWDGHAWAFDGMVIERVRLWGTASGAQAALQAWRPFGGNEAAARAGRDVGGTPVLTGTGVADGGFSAAFVVGRNLFQLEVRPPEGSRLGPAEAWRVLSMAVARARRGR